LFKVNLGFELETLWLQDAGQALRIARAKARAAMQAARAANGTGGRKSVWGQTAVLQVAISLFKGDNSKQLIAPILPNEAG
jgi:hypothetical protein